MAEIIYFPPHNPLASALYRNQAYVQAIEDYRAHWAQNQENNAGIYTNSDIRPLLVYLARAENVMEAKHLLSVLVDALHVNWILDCNEWETILLALGKQPGLERSKS